ncbi:MAG: DNA replication/repair protein RecF [Bifidobacteriaceae bacterium]|jgi:DNA replication and repair protein RecF|nr:DNA replication/repair protein RecF [Bifidobacteriaceae bacterium]
MYLTDLALMDFRSHREAVLRLEPGVTTFTGDNGQGKTNLVEAVAYLATLSSHRTSTDQALVRQGADKAVVRARLRKGDRAAVVSVEVIPGKANQAFLGRTKVKPAALLGVTQAIAFVPEDLALVKDGPEVRRRYLDELTLLLRPSMAGVLADYDKVIRQRSALLKTLTGLSGPARRDGYAGLEVWDGPAAALGSAIIAQRIALTRKLNGRVARLYDGLAGGGSAELNYNSSVNIKVDDPAPKIEHELLKAMVEARDKEIDRGVSLYGPHREELALTLNGLPARGYASHGESWSLALALRLGSFEVIRAELEDDPVLILDDVFAELDESRRQALTGLVEGIEQVLVTAAVPADVPDGLTDRWYVIAQGQVEASDGPATG